MTIRIEIDGIGPAALTQAERAVIVRALREFRGDVAQAARRLNMGVSTLYRKLNEHSLTDEERTGR